MSSTVALRGIRVARFGLRAEGAVSSNVALRGIRVARFGFCAEDIASQLEFGSQEAAPPGNPGFWCQEAEPPGNASFGSQVALSVAQPAQSSQSCRGTQWTCFFRAVPHHTPVSPLIPARPGVRAPLILALSNADGD